MNEDAPVAASGRQTLRFLRCHRLTVCVSSTELALSIRKPKHRANKGPNLFPRLSLRFVPVDRVAETSRWSLRPVQVFLS